jgi:hypothetical protein
MTMAKGCCGQPVRPRRNERESGQPLPPNPKISGGTRLLYLGIGRRTLKTRASGNSYYVSDQRRKFSVATDDVQELLRNRDVIIAP